MLEAVAVTTMVDVDDTETVEVGVRVILIVMLVPGRTVGMTVGKAVGNGEEGVVSSGSEEMVASGAEEILVAVPVGVYQGLSSTISSKGATHQISIVHLTSRGVFYDVHQYMPKCRCIVCIPV